ncbi:MAG: biotin/lipoyl-containing protein [Candidatus Omnitrophota bacterium]
MVKVAIPELGEGITQVTVSYWYFKAGDKVKKDDDLMELVTDKATFNLPSPSSGLLSEVFFHEGDTAKVGDVVAIIAEDAG